MIILDVLNNFTFTTYYEPSTPSWEVVDNSMSSLWRVCHIHKGLHHNISMHLAAGIKLSSAVHPVTRGKLDASSQLFT